jgi:hypothetical protein
LDVRSVLGCPPPSLGLGGIGVGVRPGLATLSLCTWERRPPRVAATSRVGVNREPFLSVYTCATVDLWLRPTPASVSESSGLIWLITLPVPQRVTR